MRIGDTVRFLNEKGGGRVAGFQGRNIVLVEDEDGFQIPMSINEVVVAQTDDYSTGRVIGRGAADERTAEEQFVQPGSRSVSALLRDGQDEEIDMTVDDTVDDTREVTFRLAPEEREGGNRLSACLAFVPTGKAGAAPRFDVYMVNDSNYYLRFVYAAIDGEEWTLKADGELEPNTKLRVGDVGREDINQLSKVSVQLMAYKRDRTFELKQPVEVTLRIDPVRFFKANAFRVNPFFETPALLYTLVEDDKVTQPTAIDARRIKESMYRASTPAGRDAEPTPRQREQLVGRYSDDQRKGNRRHSPYMHRRDLDDAVVVDLHAGEILDSTRGMQAGEILDYQLRVFADVMSQYAAQKGQKLVFIHGKGEGVLRKAIIAELTRKYKNCVYQDASFQEYGYGATMVTVR